MGRQVYTNSTNVVVLAATKQEYGIISLQIECPLYVWTELLTHRNFARNASSARAMGTKRYTDMGFYLPSIFYTQGIGMQASESPIARQFLARVIWKSAVTFSSTCAWLLERLHVAKEQRNRLVPPCKMIRGIVTGTEDAWEAFLMLRYHRAADKAMYQLAEQINTAIKNVTWSTSLYHNPYPMSDLSSSVAKVARVSYNRSKGKDDTALVQSLNEQGHLSPFEHVARWTLFPYKSVLARLPYGWQTVRGELENGGTLESIAGYYKHA